MKRALLLFAAVAASFAAVNAAQAGTPPPWVPGEIAVPDGHKLFLTGDAEGVQIYSCGTSSSGYAWSPVGPRADVFDEHGKLLMTHFGGPTWRARDGSQVVGSVDRRAPVEGTIPWLRLAAASTAAGPDGDRLAGTTFIQRLETTGGVAPVAETCTAGRLGEVVEVPYTAVYAFWKASGS
jgi:Protein of unknown function (DUF3455)